MKKLVYFLLLTLMVGSRGAYAQSEKGRTVALWGHVKNSLTKVGIPDTKITLMDADSTTIDTMTVWTNSYNATKVDASYRFKVPARSAKYIIKATHPDYDDCYVDFEIKRIARNTFFDVPHHLMNRIDPSVKWEKMLGEVQIKASKIKLTYKGDTIIYNADAFKLPEGSMLDALIRQLPGVELSDDGVIKVNGVQVDYLTLNGKDFFKGKNKVMLENLPNYTVKDVRAYHKTSALTVWMGREMEKKDYVMDVTLKREYSKGYITNVGVAGGTHDRYLARLFGMRYTDNSRLTIFGNLNNVNESRKPGSKGEWSPSNMPEGQQTTKHAGIDLMIDDKDKRFLESGNIELMHTGYTNIIQSASESFLSDGTSYTRMYDNSNGKRLRLSGKNEFTWNNDKYRWFTNLGANYNKSESSGLNVKGTFNSDPTVIGTTMQVLDSLYALTLNPELQAMTLNRRRSNTLDNGRTLDFNWYTHLTRKRNNGDNWQIAFEGDSHDSKVRQYSINSTDYLKEAGRNDYRNEFLEMPENKRRFNPWAEYELHWLNNWNFKMIYGYNHTNSSKTNGHYRFDRFNDWANDDLHPIGVLPSTRDSMLMAIDGNNSYDYNLLQRQHDIFFTPNYSKEKDGTYISFRAWIPFKHITQELDYHSASLDTCVSQRRWTFEPQINFACYTDNYKRRFNFSYNMEMPLPSLYQKLDITNDANPLNIRKGNPNLKGSMTHRIQMSVGLNKPEKQQWLNVTYGLRFFLNQVSQGYTFNATTGAYTFMPENVDGNWQTYVYTAFGRAIDKEKRWRWSTTTHVDYTRNVDITAVEGTVSSALSKVDNWYANERLSLDYHFNKLRAGINGGVSYRHAVGNRRDVQRVSAFDFNYGFTCNYELPWQIILATDMKMFSRRGYGESSMNTDDLIWNMSVSRAWLKGKLTSRLEGFDLLNQVSGNSITINGQGRTEVHRNALPRYVMLHLAYNFSVMPKRR